MAEVLRHHREIAGVLLERPGMLELADAYLSEQGWPNDASSLRATSSRRLARRHGDVYVLKSVLRDWDDQRCVAILRNCRAAMTQAARLVIVELSFPSA